MYINVFVLFSFYGFYFYKFNIYFQHSFSPSIRLLDPTLCRDRDELHWARSLFCTFSPSQRSQLYPLNAFNCALPHLASFSLVIANPVLLKGMFDVNVTSHFIKPLLLAGHDIPQSRSVVLSNSDKLNLI